MNKVITFSMCLSAAGAAFTLPETKTTSKLFVKSTTQAIPYFMDEVIPAASTFETKDQKKRGRPYTVVKTFNFEKKRAQESSQAEEAPPSPTTLSAVAEVAEAKPLSPPAPKLEVSDEQPKRSRPYTVVKTYNFDKKKKNPAHKEGVFSPVVVASKKILGDEEINQLRAKIISLHSNVIGDFVDTHQTKLGSQIAKLLFAAMDVNNDGTLDKDELKAAFQALGFTWLQDKQVDGILKRADKDGNGVIDYEEFEAELSKTLRTNLIKLAKKNGGDMGLLV